MAFKMKGFKPHNMYKTEKAETHKEHLDLQAKGYDHSPYGKVLDSPLQKYKSSSMKKMVPNCIPKGKLKKEKGDPCWKNYVQRGMKKA